MWYPGIWTIIMVKNAVDVSPEQEELYTIFLLVA